jgi:hypothetical protein
VTHRDGARLFGDRYVLVRHEDLLFRTDAIITDLYRRIGMEAPERVTDWARGHIRARPLGYSYADDPRWPRRARRRRRARGDGDGGLRPAATRVARALIVGSGRGGAR